MTPMWVVRRQRVNTSPQGLVFCASYLNPATLKPQACNKTRGGVLKNIRTTRTSYCISEITFFVLGKQFRAPSVILAKFE